MGEEAFHDPPKQYSRRPTNSQRPAPATPTSEARFSHTAPPVARSHGLSCSWGQSFGSFKMPGWQSGAGSPGPGATTPASYTSMA